eukprot:scaffold4720_cov382-Prasinococcus_capsulatus_cf.AAC.2
MASQQLRVENNLHYPLELDTVSLFYYFDGDGVDQPEDFVVDVWAAALPSRQSAEQDVDLSRFFVCSKISKLKRGQNRGSSFRLELTFSDRAGSIPAADMSGAIKLRIIKGTWVSSRLDQARDWSYKPIMDTFKYNDRIGVAINGEIVHGETPVDWTRETRARPNAILGGVDKHDCRSNSVLPKRMTPGLLFEGLDVSTCYVYSTKDEVMLPDMGSATSDILIIDNHLPTADAFGVSVEVNIMHQNTSKLVVVLEHHSDSTVKVRLVSKKGKGTNMLGTRFLDGAGGSFPDDVDGAPYQGTFVPEESLAKVAARGGLKDGLWRLNVYDVEGDGIVGRISAWSLFICPGNDVQTRKETNSPVQVPRSPWSSRRLGGDASDCGYTEWSDWVRHRCRNMMFAAWLGC